MIFFRIVLLSFVSLGSTIAFGDNYVAEGVVSRIEAHNNYSSARNVRVVIEGVSAYCGLQSNNDTTYLQASDAPDNFDVFVSLLLASKMSKTPVKLYTHRGPEGCSIHRVDLK